MNHILTSSPRTEIVADTFESYASYPAVNNSALSLFDDSRGGAPAKAEHYMLRSHHIDSEQPELEDEEDPTEALRFGSLYHQFILDRAVFDTSTAILDMDKEQALYQQALVEKYGALKKPTKTLEEWIKDPPGNTPKGFSKALGTYKKWKAAMSANGCQVIDQGKMLMLQAMERGLSLQPEVAEALAAPKKAEVSLYWGMPLDDRDPQSPYVQCKARIDSLPIDGPYVDDLKTVRSAAHEDFSKSIARYGYDRQAAWYLRGCHALGLNGKKHFRFIAQEKTAPYLSALYTLPTTWLNFANKEVTATFFRMKNAISTGEWSGYVSGEVIPPQYLEEIIDQESSIPFMSSGGAA